MDGTDRVSGGIEVPVRAEVGPARAAGGFEGSPEFERVREGSGDRRDLLSDVLVELSRHVSELQDDVARVDARLAPVKRSEVAAIDGFGRRVVGDEAAPVVRMLAENVLEPILRIRERVLLLDTAVDMPYDATEPQPEDPRREIHHQG